MENLTVDEDEIDPTLHVSKIKDKGRKDRKGCKINTNTKTPEGSCKIENM